MLLSKRWIVEILFIPAAARQVSTEEEIRGNGHSGDFKKAF